MSRGPAGLGAGGWTVSRKKEQGPAFGGTDPSSWPVTTPVQTSREARAYTTWCFLMSLMVAVSVPTIVLAAHQWPLLHPVLQL